MLVLAAPPLVRGVGGQIDVRRGPLGFDGHNGALAMALGLGPILFVLLIYLAAPNGPQPMFDEKVAFAGWPAQVVVLAIAIVLELAGMVAIWRAKSSRAVVGAVLLLTLPAAIVLLFGPAVLLVLSNLLS